MSRQIGVAPLVAKFLDLAEQLAPIPTSGCPSARKMLMEERRRVRRRRHRIALRKRRQTDPLVNPLAAQPQFPNDVGGSPPSLIVKVNLFKGSLLHFALRARHEMSVLRYLRPGARSAGNKCRRPGIHQGSSATERTAK